MAIVIEGVDPIKHVECRADNTHAGEMVSIGIDCASCQVAKCAAFTVEVKNGAVVKRRLKTTA